MTIPFSQVKGEAIRLRVMPSINTQLLAGPGIAITKPAPNQAQIAVDFSGLVRDDVTSPLGLYVGTWDATAGLFKLVLANNLKGTPGTNGAAGAVGPAGPSDPTSFATRALAAAATVGAGVSFVRTAGFSAAGDLGGALYRRVTSLSSGASGFQSADSAWWQYSESVYNVAAFGAQPDYHEISALSTTGGSTITATGTPFYASDVGSMISVDGMGVTGAPYFGTITGFTNANSITVSPGLSTAQTNVFGQWGKDNTSAIQAAINMARSSGGGIVYLPTTGRYCITELDMTNSPTIQISGVVGVTSSSLIPMRSVNAVIDATGTSLQIADITVGRSNQIALPKVGLLISPSTIVGGIDFFDTKKVFWTGRYATATLFVNGVSDATMYKSSFLQYSNTGYAAVFTATNLQNINSIFATTVNGSGCTDWNFFGAEFHSLAGASAPSAILLSGTVNWRFFGGIIGSSSSISTTEIANTVVNTIFSGTVFNADIAPQPVHILAGSGTISGMIMDLCNLQQSGTMNAGVTTTNFFSRP
jgi:hypothetical protein